MTTPISEFAPKTDHPYLVFLADLGGWHVGEFITGDVSRWVLVSDASVEVWPTHVSDLPPDPADEHRSDGQHALAAGNQKPPGDLNALPQPGDSGEVKMGRRRGPRPRV